jgi:hypothetical protein
MNSKQASVDWDNLQIVQRIDEEGRLQIISEEQLFAILGFKIQEKRAQKKREAGSKRSASRVVPPIDVGVDDAAIHIDDHIHDERIVVYDNNMDEFRLDSSDLL